MAGKKTNDGFANMAFLSCTESAANTLTFAQLQLANTLMSEKVALIIHRISLFSGATASQFNAGGDAQTIALTLSDRLTDIRDLSQPEILFNHEVTRWDFGAAATGFLNKGPLEYDYTSLPGGGLLVPADRLYLAVAGISLVSASGATMRLFYTVKPLDTADYWDLIEARRIMTT